MTNAPQGSISLKSEIFAQKIVKTPDTRQRYRVFSSLFILKIFFLRCFAVLLEKQKSGLFNCNLKN